MKYMQEGALITFSFVMLAFTVSIHGIDSQNIDSRDLKKNIKNHRSFMMNSYDSDIDNDTDSDTDTNLINVSEEEDCIFFDDDVEHNVGCSFLEGISPNNTTDSVLILCPKEKKLNWFNRDCHAVSKIFKKDTITSANKQNKNLSKVTKGIIASASVAAIIGIMYMALRK